MSTTAQTTQASARAAGATGGGCGAGGGRGAGHGAGGRGAGGGMGAILPPPSPAPGVTMTQQQQNTLMTQVLQLITQPGQLAGQPLPPLPPPIVTWRARDGITVQENEVFFKTELELDNKNILAR